MDISPLADKQQRNSNRKNSRRSPSEENSRLDEYSPLPRQQTTRAGTVLSFKRIQNLIDELNQMTGAVDISFELKKTETQPRQSTIVDVVDSRRNQLLMELNMQDLVEIEKQINEDSIEKLSELMCGSFFSLTA